MPDGIVAEVVQPSNITRTVQTPKAPNIKNQAGLPAHSYGDDSSLERRAQAQPISLMNQHKNQQANMRARIVGATGKIT